MSSTGTNTQATRNPMGWSDEDVASVIRHLVTPGTKLHLGECSVNCRFPLYYEILKVNFVSEQDVITGNLNGRRICRNPPCKDAYEAIQKSNEDKKQSLKDDEIKKLQEENKKLKAKEKKDKKKRKKRKKNKKIKKMLAKNGLNCGSDVMKEIMKYAADSSDSSDSDSDSDSDSGSDSDSVSVSVSVSNENGNESKESDEVDNNELIPYNSLSNMDIGSNNADADVGAGTGAGAGAKFLCDYCGKSFANEANRLKHMNDTCKKVKKNVIENDNA